MNKYPIIIFLIVLVIYLLCNRTTSSNKVTYDLYGYDACPYTLKMKTELENKNQTFEYKQIDKSDNFKNEYNKFGVRGVPLLVNKTSGEHHVGFKTLN